MHRVGIVHELLRTVIGYWPFQRGGTRIPSTLGRIFGHLNASGVVAKAGTGGVLFPYQSGDIARPAYWFLYEKEVRKLMRNMLSPGSVFIDIGAHNGWHTAYALTLVNPCGFVIACEPHPYHAKLLRELALLNPSKRIDVHEVAISDEERGLTLFASERNGWDTIHTVVPEFDNLFSAPRKAIHVRATRLDDLLGQYSDLRLHEGPQRVLIKIDAEGSELSILNGASNTLQLPSVRALIIECTGGTDVWEARSIQCIQILRESGWKPMVLTSRGVRPWSRQDASTQVNVFVVRHETV